MVLALPAVLAEMFWSAELLVALGSTFGVVLDLNLATGIVISAAVVTLYTMAGGMWAVAYTDAFQLLLVGVGLGRCVAVRACRRRGGVEPRRGRCIRRRRTTPALTERVVVGRQRDADARRRAVELLFPARAVVPHAARGAGAFDPVGPDDDRADDSAAADGPGRVRLCVAAGARRSTGGAAGRRAAADLQHVVPPVIGLLGLAAIVGAVTSSFSSSILSAGSMFAWNVCRRLLEPDMSVGGLTIVMRIAIALLGVGAVWMALEVQSVQALWFFTSDLVFVLLFPQLVVGAVRLARRI